MKLDRETVHFLHSDNGGNKTFAEIGRIFNVKRQRIWSIFTGYDAIYKKTDKYKMYKRHVKGHFPGATPTKPCNYCEKSIPTLSREVISI